MEFWKKKLSFKLNLQIYIDNIPNTLTFYFWNNEANDSFSRTDDSLYRWWYQRDNLKTIMIIFGQEKD